MLDRLFASTATLAAASIVVGAAVLALKFVAWWLTGSIALWSDALESLVNIATAVAAYAAIRYGAMPADANHPYGHHKAEYFAVVLVGVLIVLAAVSIFRAAYFGYLDPQPIQRVPEGLAVNIAASVLNALWCAVLIREGRRRRSPALIADGVHLLTDVATSAGVVVGLILAVATGFAILDPLLAALVALNILWAGWRLIRVSVGGLMDEAVDPETLDKIRKIISDNAVGAIEAHDLRTRNAGRMTFIEFHLVVAGTMEVSQSHDICDRLEKALRAEVEDSLITIHVEPEDKAKHTGVVVVV
ncbi:MAG TPA: cation diffusion facilitator family transporter [Methylomirabilota bacterium]|nr:cation diffusion facilitator family transporter [Methylomirabilota bacterium]